MRNKQLVKLQHPKARARKSAAGWIVFVPVNRTLGVGDTAAQAWRAAALALATKANTRSVRAKVDQLIDWYEEQKKICPIIRVSATANTVRKFARKRRGAYRYRDHVIVPMRRSQSSATSQESTQ